MDGGRRRSRSDSPSLSAGSRDGSSAPGRQPQSCVVLCCCRLCPRHPVTVSSSGYPESGPSTFAEPARQHTPVRYRQPSAWQRVTVWQTIGNNRSHQNESKCHTACRP
nr:uncharacterized protein LOC120285061 [Drosophila simulans]